MSTPGPKNISVQNQSDFGTKDIDVKIREVHCQWFLSFLCRYVIYKIK